MNREQLKRINELLNRIAELEKVLAIKSNKIRIAEYADVAVRQFNGITPLPSCETHDVIIERNIIEPALIAYCNELKAELKELGYEE